MNYSSNWLTRRTSPAGLLLGLLGAHPLAAVREHVLDILDELQNGDGREAEVEAPYTAQVGDQILELRKPNVKR